MSSAGWEGTATCLVQRESHRNTRRNVGVLWGPPEPTRPAALRERTRVGTVALGHQGGRAGPRPLPAQLSAETHPAPSPWGSSSARPVSTAQDPLLPVLPPCSSHLQAAASRTSHRLSPCGCPWVRQSRNLGHLLSSTPAHQLFLFPPRGDPTQQGLGKTPDRASEIKAHHPEGLDIQRSHSRWRQLQLQPLG